MQSLILIIYIGLQPSLPRRTPFLQVCFALAVGNALFLYSVEVDEAFDLITLIDAHQGPAIAN